MRTILFVALASVTTISLPQSLEASTVLFFGEQEIQLNVLLDFEEDSVLFTMRGPKEKWFGFIFNTQEMDDNAYCLMANIDKQGPEEYKVVHHEIPVLHETQNLTHKKTDSNATTVTYEYKRALTTLDILDFQFNDNSISTFPFAYAIGFNNAMLYHENRGAGTLQFEQVITAVNKTQTLALHLVNTMVNEELLLTTSIAAPYRIINPRGSIVAKGNTKGSNIPCSYLSPGTYFLEVVTHGKVYNYRFQKL